jgi:hypothetical protein
MDIVKLPDDMNIEEKQLLREYKQNGCPGLIKINADKVAEWFNLYMGGKTYAEIAKISQQKKDMILYVAEKSRWHERRMEKYQDISESIFEKTRNSILESANTVTTMVSAMNRYYTNKLNKYLATNDNDIIEGLDTKRLSQYHKTIESLERLILSSKGPQDIPKPSSENRPSVNININGPTEVVEYEESIDITKIKSSGDMLKTLLRLKKEK